MILCAFAAGCFFVPETLTWRELNLHFNVAGLAVCVRPGGVSFAAIISSWEVGRGLVAEGKFQRFPDTQISKISTYTPDIDSKRFSLLYFEWSQPWQTMMRIIERHVWNKCQPARSVASKPLRFFCSATLLASLPLHSRMSPDAFLAFYLAYLFAVYI